jgi:hypothetical protein
MKKIVKIMILSIISISSGFAQMSNDMIYVKKKNVWVSLAYNTGNWTEYWENTRRRGNLNFGTHTTQTINTMVTFGVFDDLNVGASLPHISTKSSAGNWRGMSGFQDLSLWLKYKLIKDVSGFSVHTIANVSLPATDYVADFQPMSIGLYSKTIAGRLMGNYSHKSGIYTTVFASYIYRSNIDVDKDSYSYDAVLYNTTEVPVPNAYDAALKIGYLKSNFQAEVFLEQLSFLSGDNIRKNDAPNPSNKLQTTTLGFYAKYQPKNIGINTRISDVIDGLNVAKTFNISAGIIYQFDFNRNK